MGFLKKTSSETMIFHLRGIQIFPLGKNRGIDLEFDALSIPHSRNTWEIRKIQICQKDGDEEDENAE